MKSCTKGSVVVGMIMAIIIAPLPLLWLINSHHLFRQPDAQMIALSPLGPPYADNTYSDARIAVSNQGSLTAEGCIIKAYDAGAPSSELPNDVRVVLGNSQPFDLRPGKGRVVRLSIYLPKARGGSVAYDVGCSNQPDQGENESA